MDGIIWPFLALTVALVAGGVVLAGRRRPKSVDGSRGHCSNCATPMSLRRVPFFKSRAVLGEWVCPSCGSRIRSRSTDRG
jgi:DNA-directed RNA polymerase subunit RPC12/RpoP